MSCFTCTHYETDMDICKTCLDCNKHSLSNIQRIRLMPDEEFAQFLDDISNGIGVQEEFPCDECTEKINCDVCFLEWLQSEVEDKDETN